jgi:hypothetical protein
MLGASSQGSWRQDVLAFLVALGVLSVAMISLHSLDSGLSGSDEGSHFLNSYLIWSYLTEAVGQNPLVYAKDFYIHYPKISIGHWPPLYYVFLSGFFLFPNPILALLVVNLIVGALPALLVARVVRIALGVKWSFLAATTYVLIPITLSNTVRLMLDQALAGMCILAALLWSSYARKPTIYRGLAYAAVASAAILIKGNGWVLGVFPFFHIALTRHWNLLLNWRTYASGAVALLFVGSWTLATYKISSDGFNYAWGFDYFRLATTTFLNAFYRNLGLAGLVAVVIGIIGSLVAKENPVLREMGRTALAMLLATTLFHSIVPVDLDQRYMSSAIPFLAIFMTTGVWYVTKWRYWISIQPIVTIPVTLAVFSLPGLAFLDDRPARFDMRMDHAASMLTDQPNGLVVVIDGNPGAEGSFASEVAIRDPNRQSYVVRSSQLLATSDFMGKKYVLRVESPEAVLELLDEISCSAVVVAEGPYIEPRFTHSDLLLSALRHPHSPFHLERTFPHIRHDGKTSLFLRTSPQEPMLEAVKRFNFPGKAPR